MKGIGRNIKFWSITMQKMTLYMVFMILAILTFMTFMDGGNLMEELGRTLPNYLIMVSFMSIFMNALNSMCTYFPMTVSLGSTRKQSYLAMQIVQHLILGELVVMIYACYHFLTAESDRGFFADYPLLLLGLIFLVQGFGDLVSASCLRFGRSIGVIVYLAAIVILVAAGVGIALSGALDALAIGGSMEQLLTAPWILLLGIFVDAIMIVILYLQVRKSTLQFG